MISKTQIDNIDATPNKRIFLSIIADYGLNTAISELIDNAFDNWNIPTKGQSLLIKIECNTIQQKILITDNSGGVRESDLRKLVSPGETSSDDRTGSIGVFGVGSKRAVVALAEQIKITSRFRKQNTYRVEYDDAWLRNLDWHLPYFQVDSIDASTTEIELSSLRFPINEEEVDSLREHLNITYAKILEKYDVRIVLDATDIVGRKFDQWSFSPDAPPVAFKKRIKSRNSREYLDFMITSGLIVEKGSIGGDYGVFIYCNDRLVSRALRVPEVGFMTGLAGVPHPRMSLARIIVELYGSPSMQPWTSNKSGINYNQYIFQAIKRDIVESVKRYTAFSKRLQEDFELRIKPYREGTIRALKVPQTETLTARRFPSLPPSKPRVKERIVELNKKVVEDMPWTRGLYEGLIAEELITKQKKIEQRNRIALVILDSTVEIALKDYLANRNPQPFGDDKLASLFKNRVDVHKEVSKTILNRDRIWGKLDYYYKLRCDLIHRRANTGLADHTLDDFRKVVKKLLSNLFGLRFPIE